MAVETKLNLRGPATSWARGVSAIDESQERAEPADDGDGLDAMWKLLRLKGNPPAPPEWPAEVGPFSWNPLTADGEAPVGGWAKLALQENGAVCFNGHFYVPGAPSDVTACVFSARAGDGTVYTFVGSDRPQAMVSDGSADDMDDETTDESPGRRLVALAGKFRPNATSTEPPPTLWWQVRVVSTEAHAARDLVTACERAGRWSPT